MKYPKNIEQIMSLEPDMLGFIFESTSPRFMGSHFHLSPQLAELTCSKVGIFVNPTVAFVDEVAEQFHLDFIQLHGNESPDLVNMVAEKHKVIKAFCVDESFDFSLSAYQRATYFLFDAKGLKRGGNGIKFDWKLLDKYQGETPFFLSGGIGPEDIQQLIMVCHPQFIGIDINSRFELSAGKKDVARIQSFIKELYEVSGR
ncbi:MAG: phosphoribosylanthranilate isomerase [Crocinitomicaceae bacterium]|nr:phosphoribosylanthranilate isomerase [Crocinitomicaceae bacterium]